ncbi:DNA-directed RNA polymerase subunit beta' [Candidatus Beckwithbacteria bacterium]|nr:DNA-directed RNA polymerase subunit beta' [Candidatus Beckwithbacteria bacterium]
MKNIVDFETLTVKIASPDDIKSWSYGEVTKPETINYRTLKPEKDGLFCERIFGPTKDWECYCGKYKRIRYRGIICDKCGVEVTQSRVRRERMGHIKLACPVAHIWFFKGVPSKISLLLDISPRALAGVIYFARYVVLGIDEEKRKQVLTNLDTQLEEVKKELDDKASEEIKKTETEGDKQIEDIKKKVKTKDQQKIAVEEAKIKIKRDIARIKENTVNEQETADEVYKAVANLVKRMEVKTVLTEDEYLKLVDYQADGFLEVGMGAESILELLSRLDLDKEAEKLRQTTREAKGQKKIKAIKHLRVVEGLRKAGIDSTWMIMRNLPVIPPDLRPMVQLSGGRFATSDLNDLYRRVINRNNRLKHLINLGAPEIILRNEKRMLQEAVDTLIDATQSRQSARRRGTKELKSLSEMLKGKQGRFRQNLLGKRVDYSGRSVIVVGPELALNQCGLPKDMALEMFKPYVLRELIMRGLAPNVKSAKHVLERRPPEVYDILEEITHKHPVLLNRAPTLHKLGIQAFFPVLIEGNAIRLHPCVCSGYNADFDGDQMAVHVPLSKDAQKEARRQMMPQKNLLKPADGSPITIPNKNMVLGIYLITVLDESIKPEETIYSDSLEANTAYQFGRIALRQAIKVRVDGKVIETTLGRLWFNEILPDDMDFINETVNAGRLKTLIKEAMPVYKTKEIMHLIDSIKELGFKGETMSGMSVAVNDCKIIPNKAEVIAEANKKAEEIEENYKLGLITKEERKRLSIDLWLKTTDDVAEQTWNAFSIDNPVRQMIESGGTRASKDQVKQLAAMRGLSVDPLGKIVELPTKSNFREGLTVFEYVTAARGSRKGLTDSAVKTANAGYLTRRLVDVSHDLIVRMEDCGTSESFEIRNEKGREKSFVARITGRVAAKAIKKPNSDTVLVKKDEVITDVLAEEIDKAGVTKVNVFSPITCQAPFGICQKCYGWDFSTKKLVNIGVPVGVLAAQSIGEPGTQLTMRVKHTGGVVMQDVTQGLPRVEEIFELRTPKALSAISEVAGKVTVDETDQGYEITVTNNKVKPVEEAKYTIPLTSTLKVKTGDLIPVGQQLASGSLDVKELLRIKGMQAAQEYLISELQAVYESQGIAINDKHFEVIVREMSSKVKVDSTGDTDLLPGELVNRQKFESENAAVIAAGGEPATAQVLLLGVTRAALYTDSWLSAASFQETSSVLTDAGTLGKKDYLIGLKENVIIGRLIPTSEERARIKDGIVYS